MEKVIGVITYAKDSKNLQIFEGPFLKSLESQVDGDEWKLVILINSSADNDSICVLKKRYNAEVIGGDKSMPVPNRRNQLLEYIAFNHPGCALFMPDDDDKFFDPYALKAMSVAIETYGVKYPILTAFNGLRGNTMPNNRKIIPMCDAYQECAGYFNWNAIYGIDYFIRNQFSFPEYLDPPHRSHDTVIDLKSMLIMKDKQYILLANCIMDYKYPEGANTLSTRTKRPDSPIFDAMEYLYSENNCKKVGKVVFYDAMFDRMEELNENEYQGLRFRRDEDIRKIKDILRADNYLIDYMGRVHEGWKIADFMNVNGRDYVQVFNPDYPFTDHIVRLDTYRYIREMQGSVLYERYIKSVLSSDKDYSNYLYVSVK